MSEQQLLDKFLASFYEDLKIVVDNIHWMAPERKDIHGLVIKAWQEFQPQFETAHAKIRVMDIKTYQAMGLSGAQLELKIAEYSYRRTQFRQAFERLSPSRTTSDRLTINRLRSFLRRMLNAAENIIDTLASILPVVQPVKEFKDTLASIMHA